MAAPILSYRPEIKILVATNDVSQHLGDVGSVQIRKNIEEPAGHFQIVFPDLPVEGWRESLYGLVRVMDQIQIWVRRWVDGNMSIEPWIPVLTGFIRSVGRDEVVGGDGRVQRQVIIAGQDCGAAFTMEQLHPFITWQNKDVYAEKSAELQWLKEYALTSEAKPVEEFIWEVATKTTQDIMTQVDLEFQKVFSVEKGTVLPNMSYTQTGCIWDFIKTYSDAPWNELFVRENRKMDGEDANPELVFRPTPWFDKDDEPLPDFDGEAQIWEIPMSDVVALSAHRDDSELVNHVWVNCRIAGIAAMPQMVTSNSGIVNSETRKKFGDRIDSNLVTNLSPSDTEHPVNLPMAEQQKAEQATKDWVTERRDWAKLSHEDLHEFERGSITLKGYPNPRVGDYFRLNRGDIVWEGYIVSVSHQYQAYRQYLVTMEYIRGNQYWRRKEVDQPWDKERKQATV